MADLRIILVTPEKTLFDCPVESIRIPLYDGSAGIYPGQCAPLVGRLGIGELQFVEKGGVSKSYFIDGGFVQVKGPMVSVLTNAAVAISDISRKEANAKFAEANAARGKSDAEIAAAAKNLERARKMLKLASKD